MVSSLATTAPLPSSAALDRLDGDRRLARRPDDIERILGVGVTLDVTAGQTIVLEGDPLRHSYRILKGWVRLYKGLADGRRQVIDFLGAGDTFGLLGTGRFAYCAEAVMATTLVRYPRRLRNALVDDAHGAGSLFDRACSELDRMQRQMLLLGRKSAEEKIASFILEQAGREAGEPVQGQLLALPMSRQDMADYLGLTIETVSRTFSRLKRRGLIGLPTPQQVVLLQLDALRGLAEGTG